MKIAIFCPYDFSRAGGVQSHIRSVVIKLKEKGHTVCVLAPKPHHPPAKAIAATEDIWIEYFGVSWAVNFNKTKMDMAFAWGKEAKRARQWLSNEKFDVIHFHTPWASLLSWQFLKWGHHSARIATFHDTPPDTWSGNLTRKIFTPLSRILYRHLDRVLAVSSSPASHLYKSPTHPIHIVPPCVDLSDHFEVYEKRSLKPRPEKCNILFVGRLDPRKGIDVLLDAAQRLKAEGVEFNLIIAGGGDRLAALQEQTSAQIYDHIRFLGSVSEKEKYELYGTCDIFCSPALYGESFGIVLTEAMATGRAVVGGNNSGYQTVLSEKASQCLAIPGDASDLALKLKYLIENEDVRHALSLWGHHEAAKYDIKAWIDTICTHYQRAITQKYNN